MLESFFGSGPQMWPAVPLTGLAFQPPISGGGPMVGPQLGTLPVSSVASPGAVGPRPMPSTAPVPGVAFGYTGGLPLAPPGFVGSIGLDPMGVTASSILATLAMRRGQPQGPTNDQELEDFIFDALEFIPGAGDVEVRYENGRVTLTGTVQHKRVKRDVGEIAWAIPVVQDVQNNVTIASRRRNRAAARDSEAAASGPGRKQA